MEGGRKDPVASTSVPRAACKSKAAFRDRSLSLSFPFTPESQNQTKSSPVIRSMKSSLQKDLISFFFSFLYLFVVSDDAFSSLQARLPKCYIVEQMPQWMDTLR